jgi:hypothetical protein
MWEPQPLATLRASTPCTGITLPLRVLFEYVGLVVVQVIKKLPRFIESPEIVEVPIALLADAAPCQTGLY